MTDLTEQWKKGELPNGIYYVELLGGNTMIAYMYKMRSCKKIVYRVKTFKGYVTKNQMKAVLSELPTYEEWKAQQNYEEHQKKCISIYENKEKQHTDDAIAYNELLNENTKLKELLKECKDEINPYRDFINGKKTFKNLIEKINQVLGEE